MSNQENKQAKHDLPSDSLERPKPKPLNLSQLDEEDSVTLLLIAIGGLLDLRLFGQAGNHSRKYIEAVTQIFEDRVDIVSTVEDAVDSVVVDSPSVGN